MDAGRGAGCRRRRWHGQAQPPWAPPAPPAPPRTCRGEQRRGHEAEGRHVLHLRRHCGPRAQPRASGRRQQGRLLLQDLWEESVAVGPSGDPAWPAASPPRPRAPGTYRGGVGSAGPRRAGRRLQAAQGSLPVRVGQLDHEAG